MTQTITFATKISRRNGSGRVLPIPKETVTAHPDIQPGKVVNVTVKMVK